MMALLTGLFSGIWSRVALIGGAVLAAAAAYFEIRQGGKEAARAAEAGKGADDARKGNAASAAVDRLGDDAVQRELRDKWSRTQ